MAARVGTFARGMEDLAVLVDIENFLVDERADLKSFLWLECYSCLLCQPLFEFCRRRSFLGNMCASRNFLENLVQLTDSCVCSVQPSLSC